MEKNPALKIQINGHTDNTGDEDYNNVLSEKRAGSVVSYLLRAGIRSDRMKFKGFGASKPIADNETEQGRSLNRRTEMIITQVE